MVEVDNGALRLQGRLVLGWTAYLNSEPSTLSLVMRSYKLWHAFSAKSEKVMRDFVAIMSVSFAVATAIPAAAEPFEQPPVLQASQILPEALVSGPEHRVDENVVNDGYMNHYRIQSRFGTYDAQSTAELRMRVREIYAMAEMANLESSEVFVDAMKNAGIGVVEGVSNVIQDPRGAFSGALSGVGKLFQRAGDKLAGGDTRSNAEGPAIKDAIGLASKKREYAADFGVDVYSTNAAMQAQLDRIARAGYFGGLGTGLTIGALTGPVLAVTRGTDLMNDVFRSTSPADLRKINRSKLEQMSIAPDAIDAFISNGALSPRHQTIMVAALGELDGVDGREGFLRLAGATTDENVALYRQRQSQMYAGFHKQVEPIETFLAFGGLVGARTQSGRMIFNAPLDHLAWTPGIAGAMTAANEQIREITGDDQVGQLWLTGTVSELASENLASLGWEVRSDAEFLVSGEEN